MPAPHESLLDRPLFEPALLRAASRRAGALSDSARGRMLPWASAARARYRVALELRDREARGVALGLLREAAFLALCALEIADGIEDAASSPAVAWERFDSRPVLRGAPQGLARAREALAAPSLVMLDELAARGDPELRAATEETVAWLLTLAEVRSPKELERARWLRSALLVLALLVFAWLLFAYWSALAALSAPAP